MWATNGKKKGSEGENWPKSLSGASRTPEHITAKGAQKANGESCQYKAHADSEKGDMR